jgi:hypothetical protein
MDKLTAGLAASISKWRLGSLTDGDRLLGVIYDERTMKSSTVKKYRVHIDMLQRFFILIGRYDSLLILQSPRPVDVPSMVVEDVILYMEYKYGIPGDVLKTKSGEVVKDVLDNVVYCSGSWKTPTQVESFSAAVGAIHRGQQQKGNYIEPCSECIRLDTEEHSRMGCQKHAGRACLLRGGEPNKSDEFRYASAAIKVARSNYEENGACTLLPSHVRGIRRELLKTNELANLQLYTIMIVSIRCFLRFDDFNTLKVESMQEGLHVVTSEGIKALCVLVQGKCDPRPVYLYLWCDEENPEFCPVRHLLLYLYITGISDGHLFPDLKKPFGPGVASTPLKYQKVQDAFKKIMLTVAPAFSEKFGTHTARKTSYLFAVWGLGSEADIMLSARHVSSDHAKRYRESAELLRLVKDNHEDISGEMEVSKWKSIFLSSAGMNIAEVNGGSFTYTAAIHVLADRFIHDHVGLSRTHPNARVVSFMSAVVLTYKRIQGARENYIRTIRQQPWSTPQIEQAAIFHLNAAILEGVEERTRQRDEANNVAAAVANAGGGAVALAGGFVALAGGAGSGNVVGGNEGGVDGGNGGGVAGGNEGGVTGGNEGGAAGGNEGIDGGNEGGVAGGNEGGVAGGNEGGAGGCAPKQRGGPWTFNKADRKLAASRDATPRCKLLALRRLAASMPHTSFMTPATRSWMQKSLVIPLNCLKEHFNDDIELFCLSYPKLFLSKFKRCIYCPVRA